MDIQNENDALNAVRDFDLDAWLDEIEPPHRRQTVNTRGDLLGRYAELQAAREHELQTLTALSDALPEEADPAATIGADPHAQTREQFEAGRERIAALDEEMARLTAEYAGNRATFTFKAIDPETRARITSDFEDHKAEGGTRRVTDQTLRLFLASVTSITIVRGGVEQEADLSKWTPDVLTKFLAKIGDGQAALLWEAYIGLGVQDVTPPFSLESSSGGTTSTF